MTQPQTLSAFLIGADSLLLECADILVQAGHRVLGIITRSERIARGALDRGLRRLEPGAGLAAELGREPFDHLFAITHLEVIPEEILRLPRRGAINFHDGPLPRYAGLNATNWALLAGEERHGITWHLIEGKVDAGRILKSVEVPIAPNDTALALNARCFEAAIASFRELVAELAEGRTRPREQDRSRRTYFGRDRRPAAACAIDWSQDAAAILRLFRALDFGGYWNPLGLPKIVLPPGGGNGEAVLLCAGAEATGSRSGAAPGEVTAITDESIQVAAAGEDLRLRKLSTIDGRPLDLRDLRARGRLAKGMRLRALDPACADRLHRFHERASRHESHWIERLRGLDPLTLPLPAPASAAPAGSAHCAAAAPGTPVGPAGEGAFVLAAPASLGALAVAAGGSPGETLAGLLAAFLSRLAGKESFDVGLGLSEVDADPSLAALFASHPPLRVALDPERGLLEAIASFRRALEEARGRATYARDLPARSPELREAAAAGRSGPLPVRFEILASSGGRRPAGDGDLTFSVSAAGEACEIGFDPASIDAAALREALRGFEIFCAAGAADGARPLGRLPILPGDVRERILSDWNRTAVEVPAGDTIHRQFEREAARHPDRTALRFRGETLTYRELDARADRLARLLRRLGVERETRVGISMERSAEMVVGLLGILKAGGAYVPLDPAYPRERLELMALDARIPVLLAHRPSRERVPECGARVILIDEESEALSREEPGPAAGGADPASLAYVIYTSGSTGKPKGVMVEHRNVINFFAGMDRELGPIDPAAPGVWLAVTSLSFDISVLELLWTLSRGLEVVMYPGREGEAAGDAPGTGTGTTTGRKLDFSLFYFASSVESGPGGDPASERYRLLLEGARFADEHGFAAVWTPERHFHAFGGLYPNPSVTGAAVAAITRRVAVRAGSVVAPLHHPARIAEEWALVDNLSSGRVGIAFASGWMPNDFALRPENFRERKEILYQTIDRVRRLWRGEAVPFPGHDGKEVAVRTLPRPVQPELPFWVTIAGNPETFRQAGEAGAGVLTHLLGQTFEEVAEKIALYRRARRAAGHPGEGHVVLMLHTFVGEDDASVKEIVRGPMKGYLSSAVDIVKAAAWSFPTFNQKTLATGKSAGEIFDGGLTGEEREALLEHAFERYYATAGLFGSPETCKGIVERVRRMGVDEIACLIDFGVPAAEALAALENLDRLRASCDPAGGAGRAAQSDSIPALLARHRVTHFQCTPSMASMLLSNEEARAALRPLARWAVGGEALPPSLARDAAGVCSGEVLNLYGPTETTVWSTAAVVPRAAELITIGKPIVNTRIYLLDARREPVPVGVPGELWIGGAGVVRGYLDRPELTAERFVADPFVPGERMYRTGDLARWLPDGRIFFLGRADFQVKIRGYRIELGEIEARLAELEPVGEAVVMAREDSPGDQRLVAYLVLKPGKNIAWDEVRALLGTRLPEFMVPAQGVFLDRFPQTPNGKIDRKALPAPGGSRGRSSVAFAAPGKELERSIAALWSEMLGVERVGLDDNFFDLGGHSLLAVKVHRELQRSLGKDFSITELFRFPTVRGLAGHLGGDGASEAVPSKVAGASRAQARKEAMAGRRARAKG